MYELNDLMSGKGNSLAYELVNRLHLVVHMSVIILPTLQDSGDSEGNELLCYSSLSDELR